MKKLFLTYFFTILFIFANAQSGLNYQSIVRNASGNPISGTQVFLKFGIWDYNSGAVLYE